MLADLFLVLGFAIVLSPVAAAQAPAVRPSPDSMCWAASPPFGERTDWYDTAGDFVRDTSARSPASLVKRFAGKYRLVVVTPEGHLEKTIDEYTLNLALPDSAQAEQVRQIPAVAKGWLLVPLIGTVEYQRGATGARATTDRPYRDLTGRVDFEYWPATGRIGLNPGVGIDAGLIFNLTDVEASGPFRGRWEDGGIAAIQVETPVGSMVERERGYFCALPQPR